MLLNKARNAIAAAAIAGTLLFAPAILHAQTADSTNAVNYGSTNTGHHFNWGWLGLLGLLGLWPTGRKGTVTTETRNTAGTRP
ncbi:MAG: WGxxGxxG family protein [Gemmatimonadaceae bacterium]